MIKKFIIKNYLNEILELELTNPEESGFIVQEVTGLGPDKSNLNIKELVNSDGGHFNSARTPVKNIVMNLLFVGTPMIEDTRHKSYRYFPTKKPLTLTVVTDRHTLSIDGYVESNEPDIFSEQEGCQISILCPSPYFTSGKKQIVQSSGETALFEFPFSNDLIPDPYIEEVIEEEIPGIPEKEVEIEVPEKKELIYSLSDNMVNLMLIDRISKRIELMSGGKPIEDLAYSRYHDTQYGIFPFTQYIPNSFFDSPKYLYLPFNWEREKYGTFSDEEYCVMEFDVKIDLENEQHKVLYANLEHPTYYLKNSSDPIEAQLFDSNGDEIENFEKISVGYTVENNFKFYGSTQYNNLSIKIPQNIMDNIESLCFNAYFQDSEYLNVVGDPETQTKQWNVMVKVSNVKFYKVTPAYKSTEIIPAVPAVPAVIERKLLVDDCLIDESLPDYQFDQDGKMYNLRYSEGIEFGEFNNYQFDHIISYEGTKDVGFIMTIEFEHSLSIDVSKGAGYLVITDIRYPGQSMIIDFKKIQELIDEDTGNILDSDEGYNGPSTGVPPLPGGYFEGIPAQKGDILTIDTRTGHKNVYYQRPGDWKYGNHRFNVLGAINQDAFWFAISQGENVFQIRHTFHPDNDELQPSDKDLVHANFLMIQTENEVFYEGV